MPSIAYDRAVSDVRQNPAVTLLSLALLSPAEILLSQTPLDCALAISAAPLLLFAIHCVHLVCSPLRLFFFPPFSCRLFSRNASLSYCRLREAHTTRPPSVLLEPLQRHSSRLRSLQVRLSRVGTRHVLSYTILFVLLGRRITCGGGKSCSVASRRGREFLLAHC